MRGNQQPEAQVDNVYRPRDQLELFDRFGVVDTSEHASEAIECGAFRKFYLHIFIDSTSTPTTLRVKVQFLDRWSGLWSTLKEGVFAALFWEDGDTASGIAECFSGEVAGRAMRITLTGVGTSSSAYFTVSAAVDFRS